MRTLLINAAIIWVGVIWAYLSVTHAKVIARDQKLTLFWKIHIYPLALIGLILDVVFNLTFGTIMFVELPHELLFSGRVQRHYRTGDGWRLRLAAWWAKQLNQPDERHIR